MKTSALEEEQATWRRLAGDELPRAARNRPEWPVSLDHCFMRIILDAVVGQGESPWHEIIRKPAYKHMSQDQLIRASQLARDILDGKADLRELNEQSLAVREKKGRSKQPPAEKPRTAANDPKNATSASKKRKVEEQPTLTFDTMAPKKQRKTTVDQAELDRLYALIENSDKTPFQQATLKLLCQVPPGRYTTYGHMSKFLKSHPRSIGQAMRNNHLAPDVPCHRCLAANGEIGGFGGSWGTDGKHVNAKLKLLKDEGLKFDSKGKAVGPPFDDFV